MGPRDKPGDDDQFLELSRAMELPGVGMNPAGINAVYILASRKHGTLYVGVSSNLIRRVSQHREGLRPGFTLT
ncbi:GIY-YIG nuclease family protein [Phenylobacterium sp.]|uniref:GIY-YIG nuclease family protein n=1 Tax=Phenylobacterium sp. TaxID=1871053 RepID=UPI00286E521B|nr:GIY-YIG nuclease family protein [Phenylobacterium sp.]